jgi:dihydrofolate reductase
VLAGDVVWEVSSLRRELDGEIAVHGSIRLARTLIEHDLVDELPLMVYPVVLGSGEPLRGGESEAAGVVRASTLWSAIALRVRPLRP